MKLCSLPFLNNTKAVCSSDPSKADREVPAAGRILPLLLIGALWLALLTAGFMSLMQEAYVAVPNTLLVASFPPGTGLSLDPKRPSLLLFVHPHCPCTEATLRELIQLRARTGDGLAVTIVFTIPPQEPAGWEKGGLLTAAQKMVETRIILDRGGAVAHAFHVLGSGHTLVYTPAGRLLFSGGLTPSRGHEGDTPGGNAIVRMAHGQFNSTILQQPVYGCTLL